MSEILYNLIARISKQDENSLFFDICSGIGTIGLVCG